MNCRKSVRDEEHRGVDQRADPVTRMEQSETINKKSDTKAFKRLSLGRSVNCQDLLLVVVSVQNPSWVLSILYVPT